MSAPGPVREFVALDLETTGLKPESDRVVEIGAVRFDIHGRELNRFERLVDPCHPMSPGARAVHGIRDAELAGAPRIAAVLPEFVAFLGDPATTDLLAHNARFDAAFLGHELLRTGIDPPGHAVFDTLALARRVRPDLSRHRLDVLTDVLGLHADGPHRALADSRRVKELWLALKGPAVPRDSLIAYTLGTASRPAGAPVGWDRLIQAIALGQTVRMEYLGGTRGVRPREITPRSVVHRGGVAYLVAFCHLEALEKSFRLDRVQRYEIIT